MGKLTERGEILTEGGSALANQDGDDTLTRPDRPDDTGDSPAVEGEKLDPGAPESPAEDNPAPGPADIPAPPVVEKADDQGAGDRENR